MKSSEEFVELIKIVTDKTSAEEPFALGKVTSSYTSGRPRIVFDGESVASGKSYPYLSSYSPSANDRVLLVRVKGSFVVVGKIV